MSELSSRFLVRFIKEHVFKLKMIWVKLIDFGLVVFIWTIQLVVYPSFRYYNPDSLLKWHGVYTSAVSVIVLPLMVSQIMLHGWCLLREYSLVNLLKGLLVVSTWLVTFAIFVPLHNKITLNQELPETLSRLIAYNWIRTGLWSMIFILELLAFRKYIN